MGTIILVNCLLFRPGTPVFLFLNFPFIISEFALDSCCSSAVFYFFISKHFKAHQTTTDIVLHLLFQVKTTTRPQRIKSSEEILARSLSLRLGFSFLNMYVVLEICL